MSRRLRWTLIASFVAFFSSTVAIANAGPTESVSMTLDIEAVSISITGGAVDFGGPYGADVKVQAHPQGSIAEAAPPTITNNGNVDITSLVVSYTGELGEEATCDSGTGSWAAHASSSSTDRFVGRAWASTDATYSTFKNNASVIDPGVGTGNVLDPLFGSLEEGDSIPLLLEIQTPNPAVVGVDGCTIGLSVTASASVTP